MCATSQSWESECDNVVIGKAMVQHIGPADMGGTVEELGGIDQSTEDGIRQKRNSVASCANCQM